MGTAPPPPSLFLDQTEVQRAERIFFWRPGPPLSQGLDAWGPAPLSEGLDPPLKLSIVHGNRTEKENPSQTSVYPYLTSVIFNHFKGSYSRLCVVRSP